jgi:hypothetical protein
MYFINIIININIISSQTKSIYIYLNWTELKLVGWTYAEGRQKRETKHQANE